MRPLLVLPALALAACGSSCSPQSGPTVTPLAHDPDGGVVLPLGTCDAPAATLEEAWTSDPHACLSVYAASVPGARGIAFASNGDLLVVSRGQGLVVLSDANHDGVVDGSERSLFAKDGGNHGLAIHDGHVYVSSDTAVFRYPYAPGDKVASGPAETIVSGIPNGGHSTRTLLFDKDGLLLVAAGSASNVDDVKAPDPTRSAIRRFDLSKMPSGGFPWMGGETFAMGLRNEVGLALDAQGRVWGVENGRDNLKVGFSDIHDDNPAEEINRFDTPGRFYGYPFCWSEWKWDEGQGAGTQHVDPDVDGGHDDAWCRDPNNVVPPAGVFQAHTAPLGLAFYDGSLFPEYAGRMFIALHGSWNREPATGRTVLRATVGADGRVSNIAPFVGEKGPDGALREGTWKHRPVEVKVGPDGALYVSDDFGGSILRVGRRK